MLTARSAQRSNQEWFRDAERTYTEQHQGCPWCGGSHRVFCQRRGATVIFYCQGCGFQATHDTHADRYGMSAGNSDNAESVPETMCGLPKTLNS